jgi:hypothetical protein
MSIKTWVKEFYPISAIKAAKLSKLEIIEHSLMKWLGTTPENLKKHNIFLDLWGDLVDYRNDLSINDLFIIDEDSCSLCKKYYSLSTGCSLCPLKSCGFEYALRTRDTNLMIDLIFKAYQKQLKVEGIE